MAILTKKTFKLLVWLCALYGTVTVIVLTLFGPSYLSIPKITKRYVSDGDFETSVIRNHEYSKEYKTESEERIIGNEDNSKTSNEDWEPVFNESYVAVLDDQPLHYHCNVCAIVTNSGQVLGQGAGHQIDQSDCIFRMNAAPVRGFEKDVGSRTDIRILGHSNIIRDDFIYNDSLIHDLFSTRIQGNPSLVLIPWLYSTELNKTGDASYLTARNLSQRFPGVKFYVSTPEWVAVSEEFFRLETGVTRAEAKTWLSTGWMTILFAIESCDTVNVYGMVEEQHCMKKVDSDVPYHYYATGVNDSKECEYYLRSESNLRFGHKLITEKAVFARWATRHDLNFYYPKWENITVDFSSKLDTLFLQLYKHEPFKKREARRQKMLKLREKFKKRFRQKQVKIVYKHGARGKLVLHHKKT